MESDVVVYTHGPRTWEVETGRSIEFKVILSSVGDSRIHDSVSENNKHIRNKKEKEREVMEPATGEAGLKVSGSPGLK